MHAHGDWFLTPLPFMHARTHARPRNLMRTPARAGGQVRCPGLWLLLCGVQQRQGLPGLHAQHDGGCECFVWVFWVLMVMPTGK